MLQILLQLLLNISGMYQKSYSVVSETLHICSLCIKKTWISFSKVCTPILSATAPHAHLATGVAHAYVQQWLNMSLEIPSPTSMLGSKNSISVIRVP